MFRRLLLKLIRFYQLTFSRIAGSHCRYYPSCSAYAAIQFETAPIWLAFFRSFWRILRCNQLFEGGFDHPKMVFKHRPHQSLSIDKVKFWLIPEAGDRCIVIKNFFFKG
ncbi:MAG: membrane protein insertion efficiency factor YidD [Campylobacterales bacterium]|nr:membrane protein insertion efficiency factor YidD [Campylobacterales bacterium]